MNKDCYIIYDAFNPDLQEKCGYCCRPIYSFYQALVKGYGRSYHYDCLHKMMIKFGL